VSSNGSPCYALAGFLHKILRPLAGKSEYFVKNSGHFVQLSKSANLQSSDTLISFNIISLFTNVPVEKALQVIRSKFHSDDTLPERSVLQVDVIMELLEVCLRTTYFQVDDKFFQQKDGMAMKSSLSPIVTNILRNWLLTQHKTNHRCGSSTLVIHLRSGLMVLSGYRTSSTTSIVAPTKTFRTATHQTKDKPTNQQNHKAYMRIANVQEHQNKTAG
jgi:hypothetical protein